MQLITVPYGNSGNRDSTIFDPIPFPAAKAVANAGRNAAAGVWDARAKCFWTVALNDFANPAAFPAEPRRQVRLKREDYFSRLSGTFKPIARLGA